MREEGWEWMMETYEGNWHVVVWTESGGFADVTDPDLATAIFRAALEAQEKRVELCNA